MGTGNNWHEVYLAAVLETDWAKMQDRIEAAESAIRERQYEFSVNHGGAPEERQAIADALKSLDALRKDTASWSGNGKRA
jgi:hypothetical protein